MRYLVSKEIKSETKVGKSIYLFDFFFLITYMAISLVLVNLVHPSSVLPFLVCDGIVAHYKKLYKQEKAKLSEHCNYAEKGSDGLSVGC